MSQLAANIERLQERCFRCNFSLETPDSRTLGLGKICEGHVERAFDADQEATGDQRLLGDCTLFNLLSTFGKEDQDPKVSSLALAFINASTGKSLTWQVVRSAIQFARTLREHSRETEAQTILDALGELAPRTVCMARGFASDFVAELSFGPITLNGVTSNRVTLVACTKRKGSEYLNLVKGAERKTIQEERQGRFSYRQWSFPLRAAQEVDKIVSLYWPLCEVSSAFLQAKYEASLLPPEPPKAKPYKAIEPEIAYTVITWQRQRQDGSWLFSGAKYKEADALRAWLLSEEIGGSYCKAATPDSLSVAYLLPEDRLPEAMQRLETLFDGVDVEETPSKPRRASSGNASYSRGSYRRRY